MGRTKPGAYDEHTHTTIYKTDNQQRPAVQHRELYSILHNNQYGKESKKKVNACICITESLCSVPETNTTL